MYPLYFIETAFLTASAMSFSVIPNFSESSGSLPTSPKTSFVPTGTIGTGQFCAATSVSRLLTSFWFEPYILHKKVFGTSSMPFFLRQAVHLAIVAVSFLLISWVSRLASLGPWGDFFLKGILCVIIPNVLVLAVNGKTETFRYLKNKLLEKFRS